MFDKFNDECGIFGIYNIEAAASRVALGLHALQHRGQEAAGIVTFDHETKRFYAHRALGHVGDKFSQKSVIDALMGSAGIGHVRYSTAGETLMRNVQPLFAELHSGGFAIAHNGNLTNALTLRHKLVEKGCIFQSTSDTETIIHLLANAKGNDLVSRFSYALQQIEGAYSLVVLTSKKLIGVRDPAGVRPLVLGYDGSSYVLASETCALDIIGADYVRDIEAGEMIVIDEHGIRSYHPFTENRPERFCIFEYVYFARPDSILNEKSVYNTRKNIGKELAQEHPLDADVVIPVPDSGVPAALGYAEAAGIPFELGIIRNHYVGRTFIEPTDQIRHLGVKLKHNANIICLKGKRVILVDDSIVRGTTSTKIVEMVRAAGATEVHMRIASPPTTNPCFYGVDTPSKEKLLAANYSLEEMCAYIKADSLQFVSVDGLYRAVGETARQENRIYCDACFTGDYDIPLIDRQNAHQANKHHMLKEAW